MTRDQLHAAIRSLGYTTHSQTEEIVNVVLAQAVPADEHQRARFETYFASSRRNRGNSKAAELLARMPGGDYAQDHTQRHWWTWQQALAVPTPTAQAVPAGWKLMPVEPNTEMLDAVSSCHEGRLYPQDFVHGPRAMRRQEYATWLAAAPTPTGAGDEGGAR